MKEEHKPQNREEQDGREGGGGVGGGGGLTPSTLYKCPPLSMSFQWHMVFRGGKRRCTTHDDWTDPAAHRQASTTTKDSRLPPKMKRVQRAARTAGASGSGAQASGSQAAS